jgi:GntR family transcriptional repressor for pyruvate dehydrogenase complex
MEAGPLVRYPLYRQVADRIREAILAGQLPPDEVLPTERELSEQFGVSRASVREALRSLQAQGLVGGIGASPGRTVVTRHGLAGPLREALAGLTMLERVSLADLVELRCAVETATVAGAARRLDTAWLDEAEAELATMGTEAISVEDFDAADVRFHIALARASGNEALHLVMVAVRDVVARHLLTSLQSLNDPVPVLRGLTGEHAAILAAVRSGDGVTAARLVREHISGFYLGETAG